MSVPIDEPQSRSLAVFSTFQRLSNFSDRRLQLEMGLINKLGEFQTSSLTFIEGIHERFGLLHQMKQTKVFVAVMGCPNVNSQIFFTL